MTPLDPHLRDCDHVIWDWNGTLLNDLDHSIAVVNELLAEHQLAPLDHARHRAVFRMPVIEYYRDLGFDVSPAKFALICRRFNADFHAGLGRCALWPGAREWLREVKAGGRRQSLLSLTRQDLLEFNVAHFGISAEFDEVDGHVDLSASCKIERGRRMVERSGVPARRTLLIGDTEHDLEVGLALGARVLLVAHGHQAASRLRRRHDLVLDAL